ncbi:MAG: hypothetical protein J2P51_12520, partial [Hyphomicrobiaceae bacterium]|nr:hypothetical protein [Hyphomicrobiaceae bacterium]
ASHLVADGNAASAVGRNALLEAGIVELAEVREHAAEGNRGTRTGRRYLGHHTTWYFRLNTAPAFLA